MTEKVIIEVFEELHTINENLFSFELRYFAHARSPLLYRAYQKKSYEPHQARDFKEIARLYERRMELESTLESLTQGQIEQLIVAARNKQVPQLELAEILPVALVFLTQYIGANWNWHEIADKWHFYGGDQLIFIGNNREELTAFVYGMAYNIASLPEESIQKIRRNAIRLGRRLRGDEEK